MASSTSEGPLEELLAPVVARSGLELDSVTRSRSDAMPSCGSSSKRPSVPTELTRTPSLRCLAPCPKPWMSLTRLTANTCSKSPRREPNASSRRSGTGCDRLDASSRIKLRAGGYVSGRVVAANETSATIDVDGETTTIDYSDMRKARSRVDFGTGK